LERIVVKQGIDLDESARALRGNESEPPTRLLATVAMNMGGTFLIFTFDRTKLVGRGHMNVADPGVDKPLVGAIGKRRESKFVRGQKFSRARAAESDAGNSWRFH
jgi:hypothetical protein